MNTLSENEDVDDDTVQYFTSSYGSIHVNSILSYLNNNSAFHAVTGIDVFNQAINNVKSSDIFTLDRYSNNIFQRIMSDTEAAGILTTELH